MRESAGWFELFGRWGWFASAAGAAVLYTLACPPYEWSWTAWAVPGLFLVVVRPLRPLRAFWCGALFGVLSCWGVAGWTFHASLEYFAFNRVLAGAFVVLAWMLYTGVPFGLLAAAYSAASSHVPRPLRGALAAWLWVGSEIVRASSLFGGMPWELLGHTQFGNLLLIQVADLGGVYAVSFVIVLMSVSVGELLKELREGGPSRGRVLRYLALPAGALAAVILYGIHSLRLYDGPPVGEPLKVVIVQGSIPNAFRWKREYFARNVATYAQLTAAAQSFQPDLIVWPENAVNFYIDREPVLRSQLGDVAALARDGLLVGAPRLEGTSTAHNSAYLIGNNGQVNGFYDKRRLVPFAEYNPLRSGNSGELTYVPGRSAGPLRAGHANVGALICYEVLFPRLVSDLVRNGADLLVNISNDSWLDRGDGGAPRQHFSMAVFRSIETRRYLVRASASGVSGFVNPYGRTSTLMPSDIAGTALDTVAPRYEQTFYVRWGDSWILASGALVAVWLGWRAVGRQR